MSSRAEVIIENVSPNADATPSIQSAVDRLSQGGGGKLTFGPGTYLIAGLRLRSNVAMEIPAGTTLLGHPDIEKYRFGDDGTLIGMMYARDCESISMTGQGVIDGNGMSFADPTRTHGVSGWDPAATRQGVSHHLAIKEVHEEGPCVMPVRPGNLMIFSGCRKVNLDSVTIRNSPFWTVQFADCDGVTVRGVEILNREPIPNNDGIHINGSCNVRISDCHIEAGDDAVAVTGIQSEPHFGSAVPASRESCSDVVVTNCVLSSKSSGIRVGWGERDVERCTFSNLVLRRCNRGINVCARMRGNVRDISFSNIYVESFLQDNLWWGIGEAIHVSSTRFSHGDGLVPFEPGTIERIRFSNIQAHAENGVFLWAEDLGLIRDVQFSGLTLSIEPSPMTPLVGGNIDIRPAMTPAEGVQKRDRWAIDAVNVDELSLEDVRIKLSPELPDYWRGPLNFEGAGRLTISGVASDSMARV
ncbi:MAG: right-handed parallel beta-helix repeat-containing protein [Armatimonadetes bacterium]|nr:right-handed parallel beta-helix repeat-containing protein [Armatimonadota bacterium]